MDYFYYAFIVLFVFFGAWEFCPNNTLNGKAPWIFYVFYGEKKIKQVWNMKIKLLFSFV